MALVSRRARRTPLPPTTITHSIIAGPTTLTAAATPVTDPATATSQAATKTGSGLAWQAEAWQRLDEVGELRAVCDWKASAVSRCRLVASALDATSGSPTGRTDDAAVQAIVRDIAGGVTGQAAILRRFATLMTIPGEGFIAIIVRDTEHGTGEEWHVLSREEITRRNNRITLLLPDGGTHPFNTEQDHLFRIHEPHPRNSTEPDSPARAALPILREIVRMGQNIEGAGKSRNAGNGMVILPQEISMPATTPPRGDAPGLPAPAPATVVRTDARGVMQALNDAMSTAISDPASAAALVPLFLQAPGEYLDKIRHITFSSEVTETSLKTREAAIRRLALALDVPPEVLLGIGSTTHWNAFIVEAEAIKLHIAPLLERICDALTRCVLWPMLRSEGHPDPESQVIWYDTAGLALRPDRGADADAAFDRGTITRDAYLRAKGFNPDSDSHDLSTITGWQQLAADLAAHRPELLPMLAPLIAAGLPPLGDPATSSPGNPPPAITPAGSTGLPDTTAARVAASMMLRRALALAAKRLRTPRNRDLIATLPAHTAHTRLGPVPAPDIDRLITGFDEIVPDDPSIDTEALTTLVRARAATALSTATTPPAFTDTELAQAIRHVAH